ncbi:MAG: PorP/SprF family type IX secretion system membrane protein [Chitinophagales bacterium]|nr:PorP/SprF family type IX secretion system membrane protein [Chitinophagales bacterium]
MKTKFSLIVLILLSVNVSSQDIHFSQFWEPSAFANPTHIGNFDGNLKLSGQYRNQWSQFNTPLTTMFADATLKIDKEDHYWAFSLSFLRDQLSYLMYHQIRLAGSISFQKRFSRTILGGIGFQGGTRLTSIDYSKLTYDRQWDPSTGQFQHSIPHLENFNNENIYTPFLGIGTSINIQKTKLLHTLDLAALYVAQNQGSDFVFYQPFKLTFNYHLYYQLKKNITLMPKLGLINTASTNNINAGMLVKFNLNEKTDVYGGLLYRWGIDRNADAIIPVVGVRLQRMRIGVSYDQVTSGLGQEGMKNVYELSLSYIFKAPKHQYYSIDCLRL